MANFTFFTNPMSRGQIVRWALHEVDADYEQVVTESAAICAYLAQVQPQAGLLPRETELASYLRWMFFAAGPLEQAILAHTLGFEPEDERQQAVAGFGSFERTLDTLEGHLKDHTFVCGDRFTMADVYVGSHVDWGLTFGTLPKRPAFLAYAERCQARTAYQAGKAIDNELIARMQSNA